MTPADALIAAWIDWEAAPGSPVVVARKFAAIGRAGLDSIAVHEHIAACRHHGMSIPDAVQTIVNEKAAA